MHKITRLPKGEVKIEFEIPWEDTRPYLDEAVKELSAARPIAGFRPGFASYDDVKRAHGEMKILETALERIVRAAYVKTLLAEKLETVGSPAISVEKMAPGETLAFTTITALTPDITKMPDLGACRVTQTKKEITDTQVEEAVEEMRKMRRTEARVERAATLDDLVMVDMEMLRGGVTVEGGSSNGYRVYLNEPTYVPGFAEKLVGMKAGDETTFTLPFPAEHFQKHLAGKEVDFKVKATGIFELQMPAADDTFAKGVGMESLEKLRLRLKENLQLETEQRANEAAEIEMLEKLVDASSFGEIPDLLINEEVHRMLHELETGLEEQGLDMATYLSQIKKTKDELKLDFTQQAMRRIRTAVLIKAFSRQEKIDASEEEVDAEADRILTSIPDTDAETRATVVSPDYRDYLKIQMRNRKTLAWLKKECLK